MKEEELYELVEHIMFNDLMDVELAVKSIKNYAREMCELQKQECEEFEIRNWVGVKNGEESILNCKNVCDDDR